MKCFYLCLICSLLSLCPAQARNLLEDVSSHSLQDLEKSLMELSKLREWISSEKIPLGKTLTELESRLSDIRREYEQVSRDLDGKNLALNNIKNEMKVRQDEINYLSTFFDEYTRNFESKLNVSEIQKYREAIDSSKNAPQNPDLSLSEKFSRQVGLIQTSLDRLSALIGGTRFDGTAVDPQGNLAHGKFAIVGPVALFASSSGGPAGLALSQTGSSQPAVRPLDEYLNPGMSSVVNSGEGILPLDPSHGGALKAMIHKWSLVEIFEKGGPIMWPLLIVSIISIGTSLERIIFIFIEQKRRDSNRLYELLNAVESGDIPKAIDIGRSSKYFVIRTLTYALVHREKSISNALMLASTIEVKRFSRGIAILDTAITIAPLLGLLGTVTGMMSSFSLIGGDLGAPTAITGGIAEALIATAFGLGIAITGLLPFNYLNARLEEAKHEIEAAATRLELLTKSIFKTNQETVPQPQPSLI